MNDFINKMGEYWSQLSFDKLGDILTYHHNAPILFSSGLFFFLFIGFLIIYMSLRKHLLTRIIYVTLFSIYFYYKSSGLFFFLLLFVATSDFCIAQCMTKTASKWGRKAWVVLSLCVDLGLLGYFKYFNFLREIMAAVAHELGYQLGNTSLQNITYQPLDIFLPVGISFFTFQTISYVIDVYWGRIAPSGVGSTMFSMSPSSRSWWPVQSFGHAILFLRFIRLRLLRGRSSERGFFSSYVGSLRKPSYPTISA